MSEAKRELVSYLRLARLLSAETGKSREDCRNALRVCDLDGNRAKAFMGQLDAIVAEREGAKP